MAPDVRSAVAAAKRYDEATEEFPGFMASRRNCDVGQGIGQTVGHEQGCSSLPGASVAQAAPSSRQRAFARDPYLQIVRASHVEEYGRDRQPPADAVVDFQGNDPEAGPLLRYTVVKPQSQRSPQLAHMLRMPELIE
jgi:hypothetical protein